VERSHRITHGADIPGDSFSTFLAALAASCFRGALAPLLERATLGRGGSHSESM
jgi:hypothetical protein